MFLSLFAQCSRRGLPLLFFFTYFAQALELRGLEAQYPLLKQNFETKLSSEGYWEGQQELHPVWDLVFYLTAVKTHFQNEFSKDEVLSRVFSWQLPDGTWPLVPKSSAHFDVTATIALCMQSIGIGRNDLRMSRTWAWLDAQKFGDEKEGPKINILFRIFLSMLEVLPRDAIPRFPTKILGFPKGMPMSPIDLGIFRTMLIPLLVWDFYQDPRHRIEAIRAERLASAGSQLGTLRPDNKIKSFITKPIDEVLNVFGSDWSNFVGWVGGVHSPQNDNFWAQEGLGYLLSRQQDDGGWYVLGNSLATILTLQKIIDRGTPSPVQLRDNVSKGMRALLKWRSLGKDENGTPFVPAARSNIWDSSLALQNIQLKKDAEFENIEKNNKVALWLLNSGQSVAGDWSWNKRLQADSYIAWSFYPEAKWHPDTDDSASVIEVLLKTQFTNLQDENKRKVSIQKGVNWILYSQNNDGGFPAWEKGASELSNSMMLRMLEGMPRVSDFSQADVSARVLRMLVKIRKSEEFSSIVSPQVISKVCRFLKNQKVEKNGASLWEGDWITNYTYGTGEVLSALLEASEIDATCFDLNEAIPIAKWFANIQNSDGGWGESTQSYSQYNYVNASSTVLQTTFVLKALLVFEKAYRHQADGPSEVYPQIEKGIEFLLSRATSEGNIFEKSFTGVYVKGAIFSDYTLMPHYHTLGVINEAIVLLSSP